MNPSPLTKKTFFLSLLLATVIITIQIAFITNDKTAKIVFCNVGQGDAAYIRLSNQTDILIDSGPDNKILECLGKHMPFYDKSIELAILSHSQKDHYGGYLSLVDRYDIKKFIISPLSENKKITYRQLLAKLKKTKTTIFYADNTTKFTINKDVFYFCWPAADFIPKDDNETSLILIWQNNNFKAMFTGDAPASVLYRLPKESVRNIDILKIPHHGSKYGITKKILQLMHPEVAVISAGKNNPHGHPSKEVLEMLKSLKIKVKRTDVEGDIVFRLHN